MRDELINEIESTELPELELLQKIIWKSPSLIRKAEEDYAHADEEFYKQDKMIKAVFGAIVSSMDHLSAAKAESKAHADLKYIEQVNKASKAKGNKIRAEATLNAMRNMSQAAESLKSLEQSKMKIR